MAVQKPLERYESFLENVHAVKSDQVLMTSCEIGLIEHVAWPLRYIGILKYPELKRGAREPGLRFHPTFYTGILKYPELKRKYPGGPGRHGALISHHVSHRDLEVS